MRTEVPQITDKDMGGFQPEPDIPSHFEIMSSEAEFTYSDYLRTYRGMRREQGAVAINGYTRTP